MIRQGKDIARATQVIVRNVLAASLVVAFVTPAGAASLCERLQARLNTVSDTIGDTAEVRVYARAISSQNDEIRKVRDGLRQNGCGSSSVVVIDGADAGNCRTLTKALAHMQNNLRALEEHKDSLDTDTGRSSARQRLLAALDANGCNDVRPGANEEVYETSAPVNASFSTESDANTQISSDYSGSAAAASQSYEIRNIGGTGRGGNLQTMCVRTCDGGFFPISSNATSANFARDAQVCSMMCPGTETELFYHAVDSQEADDMVSVANGQSYRDAPYAYRFRLTKAKQSKTCGCNFSAYYREMMRRESGQAAPDAASRTSVANVNAGLELRTQPAKPMTFAPPQARPFDPSKNAARQVGPVFLPAQEPAGASLHPAAPGSIN